MNKKRRLMLSNLIYKLDKLSETKIKEEALDILNEATQELEKCLNIEEEKLDNVPESLRWSAMCESLHDNVDDMAESLSEFESAKEKCLSSEEYDYQMIQGQISEAVNLLDNVIYR